MGDNSSNKIRELSQLATQFRNAIDRAHALEEFKDELFFKSFPRGCCGDATDLIGQFLLEHGWESNYVYGSYYYDNPEMNSQSHAWLRVEGLVVDITGDQFKNHEEFLNFNHPVYVGKPGKFHKLFRVEERNVHTFPGIDGYGDMTFNRLSKLYTIICQHI